MAHASRHLLGALIQAHVRAHWGSPAAAAEEPVPRLDLDLRERVDALGMDAEHLLDVPADEVMNELRALESLAALEDAADAATAAHQRARAEGRPEPGADARHDAGRPPIRHRPAPGPGAGRQGTTH